MDLLLYGFIAQFFGFVIIAFGSSSVGAAVVGILILLAGYGMILYGLSLFRGHYRTRVR